MTAAVAELAITDAGVYDMPAEVYHADPVPGGSLSSSGARLLLPPSCPALYRHQVLHGQAPRREFDFGHAAHLQVLGAGPDIVVVDADDWRTKAARQARDDAYAAGKVPLLEYEHQHVLGMAAALRAHPVAGALFTPGTGLPEQSLFWTDPDTGVWRRARLDWLRTTGGRLIVPDYKTCASASPEALSKAMQSYGYYQQAAWYLDGVQALRLGGDDAAFVLVFQERTPPYLVVIAEPDPLALRWGRERNRKALDVFRRCQQTDTWPGYADHEVIPLALPTWAERAHEAAWERGDYDPQETP